MEVSVPVPLSNIMPRTTWFPNRQFIFLLIMTKVYDANAKVHAKKKGKMKKKELQLDFWHELDHSKQ